MIRHVTVGLFAVSLFALAAPFAFAAGEPDPPSSRYPGFQQPQQPQGTQPSQGTTTTTTGQKKKGQQKSEQEFRDGYRAAYALVEAGDYKAAFAAFKALGWDDHPDVATELGYTARKLGDYEASRYWYERALAVDPNHVKTWQYYGMWQVEQGNMLKANDILEKIRLICGGTQCQEYQDLKGGIEGTVVY